LTDVLVITFKKAVEGLGILGGLNMFRISLVFWLFVLQSNIVYAELTREKLIEYSIEGVSLSATPEALESRLLKDGYELTQAPRNKKKYIKSTDTETIQVTTQQVAGTVFRLNVITKKLKPKRLTAAEAERAFEKVKKDLEFDDSDCKVKSRKGFASGKCEAKWNTVEYENTARVIVTRNSYQVLLRSRPFPASRVEETRRFLESAHKAFACFKSVDVNSAESVYSCLQKRERIVTEHELVPFGSNLKLLNFSRKCSDFTINYALSLRYAESEYESDNTFRDIEEKWWHEYHARQIKKRQEREYGGVDVPPDENEKNGIPSCDVFAKVVELATGKLPTWSQCTSYRDDAEFFRHCLEGMRPSLTAQGGRSLVSCEALQRDFKWGTNAAASSRGFRPRVPECDFVMEVAKAWRKELPPYLTGCVGYSPDSVGEHLKACISSKAELYSISSCDQVRSRYEDHLFKVNGRLPPEYIPITCKQAEPVLAQAEQVREAKRVEAEKRAQAMRAHQRKLAEMQKQQRAEQMRIAQQRYADTPEAVASRTSDLEKEIRKVGHVERTCHKQDISDLYCPPTKEEMRLAIMRRHAKKSGFKMINGHMLHGSLNNNILLQIAGGYSLGFELNYHDVELYSCSRDRDRYICYFSLPVSFNYDPLTKLSMDQWVGDSPFNFNDMMFSLMDNAAAGEEFSYIFMISDAGLWYATPTTQQLLQDANDRLQSIEAQL
jgi:hypothetical protein